MADLIMIVCQKCGVVVFGDALGYSELEILYLSKRERK